MIRQSECKLSMSSILTFIEWVCSNERIDGQRKQRQASQDGNPAATHLSVVAVISELFASKRRLSFILFLTASFCIAKHSVAFTWRRKVVCFGSMSVSGVHAAHGSWVNKASAITF